MTWTIWIPHDDRASQSPVLVTSQPLFYNSRFTILAGASWDTWDQSLPYTAVDVVVECSSHHSMTMRVDL